MTNPDFEIYKTFVASTSHAEESDFTILAEFPDIFTLYDHYYGTKIYLDNELLDNMRQISISEGLKLLILFALSNDCRYLELDTDGPIYEEFPQHDW
jgi:hypothetical protein